jgi:2-oxoisovalerate dehydrogenase E2 component (dihydrolipoyl transacylase)
VSQYVFKMPDLGEGTVEAEIVAWHVKVGDSVTEDKVIAEVMTDKAAVEVPSPVTGRIVTMNGSPGDKIPVGAPLIVFDIADAVGGGGSPPASSAAATAGKPEPAASTPPAGRVMASPATRRRAREAGIDLATLNGSGPGGRILRDDLHAAAQAASAPGPVAGAAPNVAAPGADTTEIRVIGVRRVIAERMSEAKRTIPHFAYVEEVDVTELESLRQHMNGKSEGRAPLTYLPFVIAALTRVLKSFPQCNALYDAARGVIVRHRAVHVGIATQTPDGLKVPVVKNAQDLDLWSLAAQIKALSERARTSQASRADLVGSTITVTSLGKLGGIASTPVINAPEVAIVGLNKAVERAVVDRGAVVVRRIMNLSSSFDHRFVDGYDAAAMIQALKEMIEHPATIFIP